MRTYFLNEYSQRKAFQHSNKKNIPNKGKMEILKNVINTHENQIDSIEVQKKGVEHISALSEILP